MLPKSVYNKLSISDKKKVKSSLKKGKGPGSGAYTFDKNTNPFGHYGEKIGKYISPFLGSYAPLARSVGAYGGHALGKLFGSGAYINSRGKYIPSYSGAHKMIRGSGAYYEEPRGVNTTVTSPPSFGSNRTIIRHREFIGNIVGSAAFTINTWNVNPGDESTFPWLASIAANYEKYRPIGIVFEFKSTSASALNSTNTALGTVMMAPRYNAIAQSVPQSKMEMLQIENCSSICPAENGQVGIECAKNYNPLGVLYIRNQTQAVTGSEQMYDFCDFYLATEGMQAAATIGEIWVTYEIELLTPILASGQVGRNINMANYTLNSSISTSAYFSGATEGLGHNMDLTLSGTTIIMPPDIITGSYVLSYSVSGSSASVVQPTVSFTSGCTGYALYQSPGINNYGTVATVNFLIKQVAFTITAGNAILTFSGATMPASVINGSLTISQIPLAE